MEALEVIRIENRPVTSNCYILFTSYSSQCVVVDPGTVDCCELIAFIETRRFKPKYVILTHEHFDHIGGVNLLREKYGVKVIASAACSKALPDRKKNMSVFYDGVGFTVQVADTTIDHSGFKLTWEGYIFEFLLTPGHTEAGTCFFVDKFLFTGDTFIKGVKTVTKLPTGSTCDLEKSIFMLRQRVESKKYIINCGHGENAASIDLITYDKVFRLTKSNGQSFC